MQRLRSMSPVAFAPHAHAAPERHAAVAPRDSTTRWLASTAIERSVGATLTYAALGLACTFAAYIVPAVLSGPLTFVVATPLVLLALLFFVGAGHASWRATCPRCATVVALPAPDDVVAPCPGCAAEIEGRAGRARVVA